MRPFHLFLSFVCLTFSTYAQTTTLLETKGSSGTGSWTARQAKLIVLLPGFTPITNAGELDVNKYGSSNTISETPTGFFYTKKIGNRWWIIDPEGKGQLNIAINSLYNLANDAAVAVASDRLWVLGFNGTGNFLSDENQTLRYNSTHTNQFSYTRRINFFLNYKNVRKNYYTTPTAIQGSLSYIFVLDPKFAEYCETQAQKFEQYKTEKNLLGYFIDNEINFNQDQLPNFLRDLSPGDPSYDAALKFATANGLSKEQVLAGESSEAVLQAFATKLAEHYYEVTSEALKKYDPNHLNLGSRLHGRPRGIEGVVKAAAKWCDVVSINFYDNYSPDNQITNASTYLAWIDKPCMVSEFYIKGEDAVTAGYVTGYSGAGWLTKTQTDRGNFYQNTCIELLRSGRFVGWHWFKYQDDTESNKGIFKNAGNGGGEYFDLSNLMTLFNNNRFGLINYFDGIPTYTWNQIGTASFATAANWTPTRTTPLPNDILQINGGGSVAITNVPTPTIAQLSITNSTTVHLQTATASEPVTIGYLNLAAGSILNVNAGKKLTVSSTLTNNGTLNLLSTRADGTATLLTPATINGSGTVSVQQFLTGGRNWYVSSPVTGANATTVLGSSTAITKPTSFIWYDETKGSTTPWTTETSTLIITKGYVVTNPSPASTDGVITFSGSLNAGAYSTGNLNPLTLSSTGVKDGFNLVGNPYPSYLDWNQAIKTNLNATMWYRSNEAGTYKFYTYNGTAAGYGEGVIGVPANVTNLIPPMQSFWVKVERGPGVLAFTNDMRSHLIGTNPLKSAEAPKLVQQVLRLQVSNAENSDEAVVYFNAYASNAYDAFDSPKMMNGPTSTLPDMFTPVGSEKLVINGMKAVPYNTEIPLSFKPNASRTVAYTLKASEISNFEDGTLIYIKNNLTGEKQLISDGSAYSFTPSTLGSDPAFSLLFKAPTSITGLENSDQENTLVYVNANKQLSIQTKSAFRNGIVSVYNSMGQRLINQQMAGDFTVLNRTFTPGVYVLKIHGISHKLIVK